MSVRQRSYISILVFPVKPADDRVKNKFRQRMTGLEE